MKSRCTPRGSEVITSRIQRASHKKEVRHLGKRSQEEASLTTTLNFLSLTYDIAMTDVSSAIAACTRAPQGAVRGENNGALNKNRGVFLNNYVVLLMMALYDDLLLSLVNN